LAKIKALYNGYLVDISVYLVSISIYILLCEAAVCNFCGLALSIWFWKTNEKEQNETQMKTKHTKW